MGDPAIDISGRCCSRRSGGSGRIIAVGILAALFLGVGAAAVLGAFSSSTVIQLTEHRRDRISKAVRDFCAVRHDASVPQLTAATSELAKLERQERKLLDAHYEDRVSDELFKSEEQRIRRERVAAEVAISRLEVNDDRLLSTLDEALAWIAGGGRCSGWAAGGAGGG
jgi:hypothetical protein